VHRPDELRKNVVPTGTLYGVGVGPGDPELVTLRALDVLGRCPVVAVPVTQPGAESYALSVVAIHLRPDHVLLRLHFPMTRDRAERLAARREAAARVDAELRAGRDVAFLTEGDPMLHSTFLHVLAHLPPDTAFQVVPGVSSIAAAAAAAGVPLVDGDQRLAVLPATFEDLTRLGRTLRDFDTVVLLKVHRVLDRLIDVLTELNLLDQAVLVERASHPSGRVVRDVASLRGRPVHYLSLLIVRSGRGHSGED
jgi:precorrin-2/cobalt-factor-2 C20-methyltransferase